ncbi:hypothetical protein [Sinorhizobium medicae]|uniref:hypothetical protein n=1 Tax=Sinorhizobium medicae TaxID=110321 RepID=UPI0013E3D8A8|nr:hypothetical protein [Sinorhizobium medicae]WQP40897.1 hypothetical protein U8C38_19970 [Sinorhizobium medicae]
MTTEETSMVPASAKAFHPWDLAIAAAVAPNLLSEIGFITMLLVELEWLNEVMKELHYISAAEGYWLPQLESGNRRAGVSTLVRPETSRSLGRRIR